MAAASTIIMGAGLALSAAGAGYSARESYRSKKSAEKEQEKAIKRERKVIEEQEADQALERSEEIRKRKLVYAAGQQRVSRRRDVFTGPGAEGARKTRLGQ